MKKVCVAGFISALTFCVSSYGAVQYEFKQLTNSEIASVPSGDVSARCIIEGDRSRVDFLSASVYGNSKTVISLNGGRQLYVLDRDKKTWGEIDVTKIAMAVGSKPIQIRNVKTSSQKLDDHPLIAGYPTDHFRLQSSYEVTVTVGAIPLTQSVNTIVDKWTTSSFGDIAELYLSGGLPMTGNPELDKLITEEGSKIKGLPLRQVTTITTAGTQRRSDSKLNMSNVRRQTSEMIVTSVRQVADDPSLFQIPHGYTHGGELQHGEDKEAVKMLSLEPAGQP